MQDDLDNCGICLDPMIDGLCSLPNCRHMFHFTCLEPFYRIKPSNAFCPVCRSKFDKVKVEGKGWIPALSRPVEEQEDDEEEEDDESVGGGEACFVCGGYGEVLICDGCDKLCHPHCAGLVDRPEGDWFCSECRPVRRRSSGRRALVPAQPRPSSQQNEESAAIENAWRHFDMMSSAPSLKSAGAPSPIARQSSSSSNSKPSNESASSVSSLLRSLESTTKNHHRRLAFLPNVVHILHERKGTPTFYTELFERGFLSHIRGWFQISLECPEQDSAEERHFRSVLLQQLDALKDFITNAHMKASRLNKAMLKCMEKDTGHNRKLATELFDRFCHSLSQSSPDHQEHRQSGTSASVTAPRNAPAGDQGSVVVLKRAKVRKM